MHRRRNRGARGAWAPNFQLTGALLLLAPPQLEPKIKQLQHIHKPHVTFYMHKLYLHDGSPQFDVSFPGQLPKIVAARGEIFSLKVTKYRLAAGLRPDPLGELKRSSRPSSRNKGTYF